jgi:hypothetical protein
MSFFSLPTGLKTMMSSYGYSSYQSSDSIAAAGGVPSVASLFFAILSFATGALVGFLAAIGAVGLGVIGVLVAVASAGRGRTISTASLTVGAAGVVAALYRLVV